MITPDERTRLAAGALLNSRGGRELARWVLAEARDGRTHDPEFIATILIRLGASAPVAAVVANVVCLRASAAILIEHIERGRAQVQAITPIAPMVLGRLRKRERA